MKSLELLLVVRDHDHWRLTERDVTPGTLVVFRSANALADGIVTRGGFDVVLVTAEDATGCRVAVHRDVTGRALLRALAYAHAHYGADVPVRPTTIEAEADLELASISERAGSVLAFAASRERIGPQAAPRARTEPETRNEEHSDWLDHMLTWRGRV